MLTRKPPRFIHFRHSADLTPPPLQLCGGSSPLIRIAPASRRCASSCRFSRGTRTVVRDNRISSTLPSGSFVASLIGWAMIGPRLRLIDGSARWSGKGSRLVGLALRPGFRLKARSPSNEPSGAGDDKSRGKQSSSCSASRAAWPVCSPVTRLVSGDVTPAEAGDMKPVRQCCFRGGREDDP